MSGHESHTPKQEIPVPSEALERLAGVAAGLCRASDLSELAPDMEEMVMDREVEYDLDSNEQDNQTIKVHISETLGMFEDPDTDLMDISIYKYPSDDEGDHNEVQNIWNITFNKKSGHVSSYEYNDTFERAADQIDEVEPVLTQEKLDDIVSILLQVETKTRK